MLQISKDRWAVTWQNQQNECTPSEDSDQPGHLHSLITVFAVRMKKAWVLSYPLSAQRRLWSDWADAQADLSLHWVHSHFVGFVMSRLSFPHDMAQLYYRRNSYINLMTYGEQVKFASGENLRQQSELFTGNKLFTTGSMKAVKRDLLLSTVLVSIHFFHLSPVRRICVFELSVMTSFNCACPAIQRGQGSGFLSEGSSWLTACMSEQRRFWRDCADAQARLNLRCSPGR